MYEKNAGSAESLMFFDSQGGSVPSPLPGARERHWARSSDGAALQVAFDREGTGSTTPAAAGQGFYVLDFATAMRRKGP